MQIWDIYTMPYHHAKVLSMSSTVLLDFSSAHCDSCTRRHVKKFLLLRFLRPNLNGHKFGLVYLVAFSEFSFEVTKPCLESLLAGRI